MKRHVALMGAYRYTTVQHSAVSVRGQYGTDSAVQSPTARTRLQTDQMTHMHSLLLDSSRGHRVSTRC